MLDVIINDGTDGAAVAIVQAEAVLGHGVLGPLPSVCFVEERLRSIACDTGLGLRAAQLALALVPGRKTAALLAIPDVHH